MNKNIICSIICKNYISYAQVLYSSIKRYEPDSLFYLLIIDIDKSELHYYPGCGEVITLDDLGIENISQIRFLYNNMELSTNVKPRFLEYIIHKNHCCKVIYFDPDICLFNDLGMIYSLLDNNSIIITPHITKEINDDNNPPEHHYLNAGVFNLGFIALKDDEVTLNMLTWWSNRCLQQGFNEPRNGLFVDQKWVNLVPCLFNGVYILKHIGCNVAYWNLHYRKISLSKGKWYVNDKYPLIYFHFSGIDYSDSMQISKYQDRFDLCNRPDLKEIFNFYRNELFKYKIVDNITIPYKYDYYSSGETISDLARKMYYHQRFKKGMGNPFDSNGRYYKWVKANKMVGKCDSFKKYNSLNYNKSDIRLKIINKMFKILLYVVGIDKYLMIMRYLSYISIIRNQKYIFINIDD